MEDLKQFKESLRDLYIITPRFLRAIKHHSENIGECADQRQAVQRIRTSMKNRQWNFCVEREAVLTDYVSLSMPYLPKSWQYKHLP